MDTQKIQITLTPQEIDILSIKSKALGYNVTKYIKFLIMKEASSIIDSLPAYNLPDMLEDKTRIALKEHHEGKSQKIQTLDELDSL